MVVTSGLPLLMIKGKFTSLETMSVSDLETFIPFMTQCSVQRASAATVNNTPVWWLNSVEFQFPLKKPGGLSPTGYRRHLVSIVCRCFYYHDQQYILQFCTQLARNPESVTMKANDDNTTSLFYSKSHLHILTFNNKNQEYDSVSTKIKREPPKSPRRCLLPNKPRPITDVYLCENCDAEFSTQPAIAAHERQCYGGSEPAPAEPVVPVDVLGYLQLGTAAPPPLSPRPLELSLLKNRLIEFSSLLGRRILGEEKAKRDLATRPEKLIQQYEAYCSISPRASHRDGRGAYDLRGSYRTQRHAKETCLDRPYCFSRAERIERYLTLKTGLNRQSRDLKSKCKGCSVPISRWKPCKSLPPPSPPLITLEKEEDEDPLAIPDASLSGATTPVSGATSLAFTARIIASAVEFPVSGATASSSAATTPVSGPSRLSCTERSSASATTSSDPSVVASRSMSAAPTSPQVVDLCSSDDDD